MQSKIEPAAWDQCEILYKHFSGQSRSLRNVGANKMVPMIGVLFILAAIGIVSGIIALFFEKLRRYSAYLAFSSILATLFSFLLFWGSGLLIEKLFGATRWSTLGAFTGYVGGLCIGGAIGFFLARRINAKYHI